MKRIYILLLLVLTSGQTVNAKEYSGGWELWYPYQYHNKKSELVGVDIKAFSAIMKEANVEYSLAEIPWKTHLHFVKTGKVDMAMGASWTEARCQYAYFSHPYRTETVNLFVKKGNATHIKLNKLSDLSNRPYIIGVEGGYFYGDEYSELIKRPEFSANISEVIDIEDNVRLLLSGHLDGFLADPYTVEAFIEKYRMQGEFEKHSVEIYSDDIYIILSKASADIELLNRINAAIVKLSEQGQLTTNRNSSSNPSRNCNSS